LPERRRRGSRPWQSPALISFAVIIGLALLWQLASVLFGSADEAGEPLVPGWGTLITESFPRLSDYWQGRFGLEPAPPGEQSYGYALLAIASHSIDTWMRLLLGVVIGSVVGTALGLAVSVSAWARRVAAIPAHILRTLPLLAMVPLFQLWFGISLSGMVIFVAYGIGVVFFAATINAVANVRPVYIQNARTLGASDAVIYRTVILPAIFPELRSAILLCLGLAWSLVLGAEYLGAQTGLGQIIVYSELFGYVDRMFIVALVFVVYAALSYVVFARVSARLTDWVPRASSR
jgi:sulfonate transport system permease protein